MERPVARLEKITEAECCWLADFIYDHSDGWATMKAMPHTRREWFEIKIHGVSQEEAERTLASYRRGDDPVWVDWAIRNLEEDVAGPFPSVEEATAWFKRNMPGKKLDVTLREGWTYWIVRSSEGPKVVIRAEEER